MKKEVKGKLVEAFKLIITKATSFAKRTKNGFRKPTIEFGINQKKKQTVLATTTKFKQSSTKLKKKAPVKIPNMAQIKCKATTAISRMFQAASTHTSPKQKKTILISVVAVSAILNVFFLTTISAQYFTKSNVYSYGTVQIQTQTAGLNVYGDSSTNTLISSLPWGTVSPGASTVNTVYVKNEGSVPLTLTLDTANWNPSNAPNYISLRWNYNGQALAPGQSVRVSLTLTVSQNVNGIGSFNFDIVINGNS